MKSSHKEIRELIRVMAPRRAKAFINQFELPAEESSCIIECDVNKLSTLQASDKLHISPEVVKRRRQAAFAKIADDIAHTESSAD